MNLAIVGVGAMGKVIKAQADKNKKIGKVWTIDPLLGENLWYLDQIGQRPDVIIDFSHPDNLNMVVQYLESKKGLVGVVIGTTGYTQEQQGLIDKATQFAPVLISANYSYGVTIVRNILEKLSEIIRPSTDIEIIEKHHRKKADAPSGTALLLADAIDPLKTRGVLCGRRADEKKGNEIGISSMRGGTIVGEHEVILAMEDEVVEIKHKAYSKTVFANGAIEGALWIYGKSPGRYSFNDMLYCGYRKED